MKRVLSIILTIAVMVTLFPSIPAKARYTRQTPINEGWARIRYAGNGRYLDIPSESFYDNGTQLQIWDYVYGNQNQIFYFHDTGKGWRISSHLTGKVIEVSNSSHNDYAQVGQWDTHELACARWDIIPNSDGTVSFRNRESGLYLNVCGGGNAPNGAKMIQYHNDGTVAMKFYLEVLHFDDILSATFARTIYEEDMEWNLYSANQINSNITNHTGWWYKNNGKYYYPKPYQSPILVSVEYLSPNTVANLLRDKAYNNSTWNEIKDALNGELSESAISALISKLGFSVPGIGYALGILQVLWDSQDSEKWNRFVDAAQIDSQGRCSGVIVYTYYNITMSSSWGPLNNGTSAWGTIYYIQKTPSVKYKSWTGDNFEEVSSLPVKVTGGRWCYYFK